jgi:hypothetical protein
MYEVKGKLMSVDALKQKDVYEPHQLEEQEPLTKTNEKKKQRILF